MKSRINTALFLYAVSLSFAAVSAQEQEWVWAKAMPGNGISKTIVIDPMGTGETYTAGYFSGTLDCDPGPGVFNLTTTQQDEMFLVKLDASGNFVWAKALGGSIYAFITNRTIAIDPLGSGDIYVTGYYKGTRDFDPGIGTFHMTAAGAEDVFISKFNTAGEFLWAKSIGGPERDFPTAIAINPTTTREIYLSGSFEATCDFDPGQDSFYLTSIKWDDMFIVKLDENGNLSWAKSFPGTSSEDIFSIALDPNGSGDVFATGLFDDTADFNPDPLEVFELSAYASGDVFIVKLDAAGNFLWVKVFSGNYGVGIAIAIDPGGSGDIYTLGLSGIGMDFDPGDSTYILDGQGMFISKLGREGNFVWARQIELIEGNAGFTIALDPKGNGSVYTTGYYTESSDFDPGPEEYNLTSVAYKDIFISRLDYDGNFISAISIGGGDDDVSFSMAIDTANNGELISTGGFWSLSIELGSTVLTDSVFGSVVYVAKRDQVTSLVDTKISSIPIALYPNPTVGSLTLETALETTAPLIITIYNVLGEKVMEMENKFIAPQIHMDLSQFEPGIYFIEVAGDNRRSVRAVTKL